MRKHKTWLCFFTLSSLLISSLPTVPMETDAKEEPGIFLIHQEPSGEATASGRQNMIWVTEDGIEYEIPEPSTEESSAVALYKASLLPSSYDLRDENRITEAKDQGYTGACWSYAGIGAVESNLLTHGMVDSSVDLSELHLLWFTYHAPTDKKDPLYGDGDTLTAYGKNSNSNPFLIGGNSYLFMATLGRWSGVIGEELAPMIPSTYNNAFTAFGQMAYAMESKESLRYESRYHLQEAELMDGATRDRIKEALMEQGALSFSYYSSEPSLYEETVYQNKSTRAYYQNMYSQRSSDHAVLLAGWDDNFPREAFSEKCRPSKDGAWLVRNSWGTEWGDEGYFWISYEEPSLVEFLSIQMEPVGNYDKIYQYDGYAIGAAIGSYEPITMANVFQAESAERLEAVSFHTRQDGCTCKIKIYRKMKGALPTSGTLVANATTTVTEEFSGYHTVALNNPITLKKGEKFSVVVTYQQDNGIKTVLAPVEGNSSYLGSFTSSYDSKKKQSYLWSDGQWEDMARWIMGLGGVCNNAPIKAFTTILDSTTVENDDTDVEEIQPSGIKLLNKKKKLKVGKKYRLRYKILPEGAVSSKVTFSSSKKKVAAISRKGVIKAKKKGRTKITVKTAGIKKSFWLKVRK